MSNVTAGMVAQLREITGLGMMECKKALVEANGDIKKAEELIRIKSGSKAGKVAGRTAAEGMVAVYVTNDCKQGALVEVNCETDFVAKDTNFVDFANSVARAIVDNKITSLEQLSNVTLSSGKTVEDSRKDLIAKLGENISIRRFELFSTNGTIANYLHGKKIGVVIDYTGGDLNLGKDIAMHIAASKPICVSKDNVPADKIESERNIYTQQAASSGKPAEIVAKMVDGRINKYLAEVTLLGQPFVKNPELSVEKLLSSKNAKVNSFAMFVVGEGIEKKEVDFAAEVAAASNISK
ncbi:MAG: translation elongation factor Ts [Burkholderiales bacterium]|nr:translation elongation factor Ts [Burkholderiales bacterium]